MATTEYVTLKLTKQELLALCSCLDSFSALAEGISDDGTARKEIKKIDKGLLRNGYKREYN